MKSSKLQISIAFFLLVIATAWGTTRMNDLAIWNSTVNNTPIGQTTANVGTFTTLSGNSGFLNTLYVNFHLGSYAGAIGQALAFGIEGGGDADYIAANGGSSPKFNWYYQLGSGSSLTKIMWIDNTGVLNEPFGINSTFNGNLTGTATNATNAVNATFATTAGSTSGNSATASQFSASPTNCGARFSNGIQINGNAICNTTFQAQSVVVTTGICTTPNSAGAQCSLVVTWPTAFANNAYGVSCSMAPPSGTATPFLVLYAGSKSATQFTVTLQNGTASQAGTNTTSEIDCTGIHN